MRLKNKVSILLLLLLFSCFEKNSKQDDEKINTATSDTIVNGEFREYYDNGNVKTFKNYNNGIANGAFIGYYFNGKVKEEGIFQNGYAMGAFKLYDSTGVLTHIKYYEVIQGESKLNQFIKFDKNGNIIKDK